MTKNIYIRTVKLNNRKTCPTCNIRLNDEKIYSSGEYIRAKWNGLGYFCVKCFNELDRKFRNLFLSIEYKGYHIRLPDFIISAKLNSHPYSTLLKILNDQDQENPRISFNIIKRTKNGTSYIRFFTIDHYKSSIGNEYNRHEVYNVTNLIALITNNKMNKDRDSILCSMGYGGFDIILELSKILYNNKDKIIGNCI